MPIEIARLPDGRFTLPLSDDPRRALSDIELEEELAKTVHDSIVLQGTMIWAKSWRY
jgi:hypothetical protein